MASLYVRIDFLPKNTTMQVSQTPVHPMEPTVQHDVCTGGFNISKRLFQDVQDQCKYHLAVLKPEVSYLMPYLLAFAEPG